MSHEILNFLPGEKVFFSGESHRIKAPLSLAAVLIYKESQPQQVFAAKFSELMPCPGKESVQDKQETFSYPDISLVSEEDWVLAKHREAIIKPLVTVCTRMQAQAANKQLRLSERQLYKLVSRYRHSGCQLKSLIPIKPSGGRGKGRLSPELETIIRSTMGSTA